MSTRRHRRICIAWLVGVAAAGLPTPASARLHDPVLVSQTSDGMAADLTSFDPSISADGRYVAFTSDARNLSTIDNDTVLNVYVRDLATGSVTLVSQANGVGGNGNSLNPAISADGRFVAFESEADNLSTADNNGVRNIFVRDLELNTITLASVTADNSAGADGDSFNPAISADGRFVAFDSGADNIVSFDNDSFENVFVRDLDQNATTLVSVRADNMAGANGDSSSPSLSANGRLVAFEANAPNISPNDLDGVDNVFVRNISNGTTTLVSRGPAGAADAGSSQPSISGDGLFVAFTSSAGNLTSINDEAQQLQIFVRDLQQSTTTQISQASGIAGNSNSDHPSISGDGRFVAFATTATNLSTTDDKTAEDVFVGDVHQGTLTLVSELGGAGGTADSSDAATSSDGHFVAFDSQADNLSTADNDMFDNVFRQDLVGTPPTCSGTAQTVTEDTPAAARLPCTDDDGDAPIRSIVTGPAHGRLGDIDQATGTVLYTPTPGYAGPDSFTFQAADASGVSAPVTVALTVAPPGFGVRTLVTLSLAAGRPFAIRVRNANGFAIAGRLAAKAGGHDLRSRAFRVVAGASTAVKLALPQALRRRHRLRLRVTATVIDPAGNSRVVATAFTLLLRRR